MAAFISHPFDNKPEFDNIVDALVQAGVPYIAQSTREALEILSSKRFAAIISDMGRKEGPREGYVLLDAVRASDPDTPFFIYAGSNAPAHKREATAHGAQGSTNRAQDLFDMLMQAMPEDVA